MNISKIFRECAGVVSHKGIEIYRIANSNGRFQRASGKPLERNTVLYDAFEGMGVLDSPRALFLNMIVRPELSRLDHVWTINDIDNVGDNIEEFAHMDNVYFVERGSKEYVRALATSEFIICNSLLPSYFYRRENQNVLNTWHGLPLLKAGYDVEGKRIFNTKNIVRSFLNSSHLIAGNQDMFKQIYCKAYKLEGIFSGIMLNEALPRMDAVCNTDEVYIHEKLQESGYYDGRKIILYMPCAVNGDRYSNQDIERFRDIVTHLRNIVDINKYQVYLKFDGNMDKGISDSEELKSWCIPFTIDTAEMLSVVDILITDYSSTVFDFLATGRPILFYRHKVNGNDEEYRTYLRMNQLPGPVAANVDQLGEYVCNIDSVMMKYSDAYRLMRKRYCQMNIESFSSHIVDAFILGKNVKRLDCSSNKIKVAFVMDWRKSFAVQDSLLRILDNIDYDQLDVTLITSRGISASALEKLENINSNVRILESSPHIPENIAKVKFYYDRICREKVTLGEAASTLRYDEHVRRLMGYAMFDNVILIETPADIVHWMLVTYSINANKRYVVATGESKDINFNNCIYMDDFDDISMDIRPFYLTK